MKQRVLDRLGCSVSQLGRSCSGALSDHGPPLLGLPLPFLLDSVNGRSATQVPSLAIISCSSLLSSHIQSTTDSDDTVASASNPLSPHSYKPLVLSAPPRPSLSLTYRTVIASYLSSLTAGSLLQSVLCSQSEFPNGHV